MTGLIAMPTTQTRSSMCRHQGQRLQRRVVNTETAFSPVFPAGTITEIPVVAIQSPRAENLSETASKKRSSSERNVPPPYARFARISSVAKPGIRTDSMLRKQRTKVNASPYGLSFTIP